MVPPPGFRRAERRLDQVTPFARGAPSGRCGASAPRSSSSPSGYLDHRGRRFCAPFVPFLRGLRPVAERPQCPPSTAKVSCLASRHCLRLRGSWPRVLGSQIPKGLSRSVVLRSVDCWPLAKDLTRLSGAGLLRHPSTLSAWSGRGIPLSGCAHRSSAAAFTGRASLLLTTPWEA